MNTDPQPNDTQAQEDADYAAIRGHLFPALRTPEPDDSDDARDYAATRAQLFPNNR
ncbi:MAG TPA: hypothetical protein VIU87_21240 [Mycobacterium sp.]